LAESSRAEARQIDSAGKRFYSFTMIDDISRTLQAKVLEALSPEERWKLNEKEAEELLRLYPEYSVIYLKNKFSRRRGRGR
jgi:hypothetical protein